MQRLKFHCLMLLLMSICIWSVGCQSKAVDEGYQIPEHFVTHNNPRFNFSVDYLKEWGSEVEGTENYEATSEHEARPDAGVRIFVENDPDQRIYIYGQVGTLMWDSTGSTVLEDIVTFSGLKVKKYMDEYQDQIDINYVFDHNQLSNEGYNTRALGSNIIMSKEMYDRYKEDIDLIIQSIRITK